MTRSKCGLLLLLAAGAGACGGDPTGSLQEAGKKIAADPSVVFVNQGANIFVVAQLLDDQGNQLPVSFESTDVGSQITVVKDTTFLETTNGTKLNTRERFVVTGLAPGATSFAISGGGLKDTVPVSVIPTSLAATFSNAAPGVNEAITITAPAGYSFGADATVESVQGAGFVQSISPDGTSISAIIPPGSTGPLTLSGVSAAFLPGVSLTVPTIDAVAAGTTPMAGTGSTATAPEVPVPAVGATTNFFDSGTWSGADITADGGLGAQYYKFTITEAGDYDFVTGWGGGSDLDPVVCSDPTCSDGGAFAGTGIDHPEVGTLTLDPGTYYFASVLFAGSPPPYFSLSITHEAPATGE
jgi:hypothetical protein